ncbi:TPA: NAD(P)H-dependent oxidoreductase [Campylobacter jejuni]|uniref:NAD(P)H-dependent oxidoreductase n=1 Tax=Campylobacter jejuni TaxID=197 RepID=UPI00069BFC21|nr:NAD(P)H-dependent oxidoreductase [Campylobacter jejuni]EAI3312175.1 NAD(P)H-dependent oxidoreductase [Campylobacter jejuni]EAJ0221099.1 NAD(P)H-dependent oxidoreductase [Campylobacter jejuni]EAJ7445647.1 NAD(P)H-dependent oxidoreductase [Campylobacter jejuni]EAK1001226.1 NAD(P)H-dependent oxidoreductase [Campylobacter jejuni]ECL3174487.1 NAD(P)H-dependent oxidoreductase [Campylobacter jejuni]
MNFKELISKRRACKLFNDKKINEKDLHFILESGVLAPSSHGFEPWKFIVVQDEKRKEELSKICNQQKHVKDCAALIIIISRLDFLDYFEEKLRKRDMSETEIQKRLDAYMPFLKSLNQEEKISYAREQAHIALASILYSANALNIASCTIGGFDKQKLNSYLSLDIQKERSSLVVALGYCNDEKNPQKNRFSFDEVVKFI